MAIITLNRPHADNAITTELAAQLIEVLETIAAHSSVRIAILTGAGDRAFSIGGDLYQRKEMTKNNGCGNARFLIAYFTRCAVASAHYRCRPRDGYGGGCEMADQHRLHHRLG